MKGIPICKNCMKDYDEIIDECSNIGCLIKDNNCKYRADYIIVR